VREKAKPLSWLVPFALLTAMMAVQSCGSMHDTAALQSSPPRPTVNHALHQERELECGDCHDPDETGTPTLPKVETCFECHEDLAEENERVNAYFDAVRQPDGTYLFERPAYTPDLIVNHPGHAQYEVACADCHGPPTEEAFARPTVLDLKRTCLDCHRQRGASVDCATCHREIRKEQRPPDHDAAFLRVHGAKAPEGWQVGAPSLCAQCHEVPQDCNSCHRETKPASHRAAGFRLHHGTGDTDAHDQPFAEVSCSLCHEELSCVRCHQTTKPRNHTVSFERRLHGIHAAVERQSCRTCHQQDMCNRCHQETRPVSHRGIFGSGAQAHCLGCHDPLPANGCYTCHKSTIGHLMATPLPPGPPHATATDCSVCHPVLPHFDDGGNCRRCHR
jgi:hypothetical protein